MNDHTKARLASALEQLEEAMRAANDAAYRINEALAGERGFVDLDLRELELEALKWAAMLDVTTGQGN